MLYYTMLYYTLLCYRLHAEKSRICRGCESSQVYVYNCIYIYVCKYTYTYIFVHIVLKIQFMSTVA